MIILSLTAMFLSIPLFLLSNVIRIRTFIDEEKQAKNDRNQIILSFLGTALIFFGTTVMLVLAIFENRSLQREDQPHNITCYSDGNVIFSSDVKKAKFSGDRVIITGLNEEKWVISNTACVSKQN